jgi:ABC-type arginine transport system permease subunit
MIEILPGFLPVFLAGLVVNLEIAAASLVIGLALGLPLAASLGAGRALAAPAGGLVGLLRAAPSFVVMFFLLNILPREIQIAGHDIQTGLLAVILANAAYAVAYIADNGLVALRALRAGNMAAAVLFLPNVTRAFFVLTLASSMAAAVGTPEAIFVTLRQAERLPALSDQVMLFVFVMLFFGAVLQAVFAVINAVRAAILHRLVPA